jgi:TRAP-type C4-dicarboxylate transport system substrate-binding protein
MSEEPLANRLLTLIKTTALEAVNKTGQEREDYLEANKAEYRAYAQEAQGVTDAQADDWARQMDAWVREMIEIVVLNDGDPDAKPEDAVGDSAAGAKPNLLP